MITLAELTGLNTRSLFPETRSPSPGTPPATTATDPGAANTRVHSITFVPCRKVPYESFDTAEAQRILLVSMPNCKRPETLVVYVCHNCAKWHVGHDDRAKVAVPESGRPKVGRVR